MMKSAFDFIKFNYRWSLARNHTQINNLNFFYEPINQQNTNNNVDHQRLLENLSANSVL